MLGPIILTIYLALSGTIGAWWLASQDVTKDEIDMLDVAMCIIPAIMMCWLLIPIYILSKIKIKKL